MFKIIVKDTYDEVSKEAFKVMKAVLDEKKDAVLGLATGSTPIGLYQEMIKDHKENGTSYKDVITFNLDEYVGLPGDHDQSYRYFMDDNLFNHINIDKANTYVAKGVGDVGYAVLKERRILGDEGMVIVVLVLDSETGSVLHGPEMLSKGFVFAPQYSHLLEDAKCLVLDEIEAARPGQLERMQEGIRSSLRRFFRSVLERDPVVVPIISEV